MFRKCWCSIKECAAINNWIYSASKKRLHFTVRILYTKRWSVNSLNNHSLREILLEISKQICFSIFQYLWSYCALSFTFCKINRILHKAPYVRTQILCKQYCVQLQTFNSTTLLTRSKWCFQGIGLSIFCANISMQCILHWGDQQGSLLFIDCDSWTLSSELCQWVYWIICWYWSACNSLKLWRKWLI